MYDVIVVGAGPAGCTAAKTLAEKGYHVLLVEKFKIPRYKSCSGILIQKAMELIKLYFGECVPESVMCKPTDNRGLIFTSDKGKELRFEQEGRNVWRSLFDGWLTEKARESGVEVRDDTVVVSCEDTGEHVNVALHGKEREPEASAGVHTRAYTETAGYVLDCEGVAGTIKHKLIKTPPAYITTFQTFNMGSVELDPHYFYAYLQPELSEYDAWLNVKDDLLVLGVAGKDTGKIPYFYRRFLSYLKKNHQLQLANQLKSEKWLMIHVKPGCYIDYGIGRVLFAGEAAGFLNPMGEGISAAMESGYCVACAATEHFENMEMLYRDYRCSTEGLKSYMQRQWSLLGGMADTFRQMR